MQRELSSKRRWSSIIGAWVLIGGCGENVTKEEKTTFTPEQHSSEKSQVAQPEKKQFFKPLSEEELLALYPALELQNWKHLGIDNGEKRAGDVYTAMSAAYNEKKLGSLRDKFKKLEAACLASGSAAMKGEEQRAALVVSMGKAVFDEAQQLGERMPEDEVFWAKEGVFERFLKQVDTDRMMFKTDLQKEKGGALIKDELLFIDKMGKVNDEFFSPDRKQPERYMAFSIYMRGLIYRVASPKVREQLRVKMDRIRKKNQKVG